MAIVPPEWLYFSLFFPDRFSDNTIVQENRLQRIIYLGELDLDRGQDVVEEPEQLKSRSWHCSGDEMHVTRKRKVETEVQYRYTDVPRWLSETRGREREV